MLPANKTSFHQRFLNTSDTGKIQKPGIEEAGSGTEVIYISIIFEKITLLWLNISPDTDLIIYIYTYL